MEKYKFIKNLGDGSYGVVSKAVVKGTREFVAVKKLKRSFDSWDECSEIPEVLILRRLHHPNIIKLREVIREGEDLYLIFDYMECSLIDFMKRSPSTHPLIVSFIRQTLEGLAYIHKSGFMHRDVKPENILILDEQCKIGDFGLSKRINCPRHTDYISTRWYRAPELLLHSTSYNSAIDMFAMGCIIAEIYLGRALFPGCNEEDQLERITCVLGTPRNWSDGMILASRCRYKFKEYPGVLFNEFIQAPRQALRLIELLVRWDPNERYTAAMALKHPFLADSAGERKRLPIYPEQSRSAERLTPRCKDFYKFK